MSRRSRRAAGGTPSAGGLMLLAGAMTVLGLVQSCAVGSILKDPPVARRHDRPRFVFDAGTVWKAGTPWVDVEISVPYQELMFRPDGDRYRATFDLIAVLYEGHTQVSGDLWHETIVVPSLAGTRSGDGLHRRGVLLRAHPGKLRVEVTVSEPASGNEGHLTQGIEILDLARENLLIGKVWFERCGQDRGARERSIRNQDETIVSRRFGSGVGPVCVITQVHAHGLGREEGIELQWKILDVRRETIAQDLLSLPGAGDTTDVSFRLPIEQLWLGGYELWLGVTAGGKTVTHLIDFEMDETVVSLEHNPTESIALVRAIATSEEISLLEEAGETDRKKAWDEFWRKRDSTPETEVNEFKQEFFSRVRYANEHFSSLGPGWRTDRGMVYIQYGAPDQVESLPHNIDGPPYEIWTYYTLRRRFVFVDYDGFGRFELYTPGRMP